MLDHVGLEVADLARSARFYDAVMFALGGRRIVSGEHAVAYGRNGPELWIVARGQAEPAGSGHVALAATGRAAVEAAYAAGTENGGTDDGPPGPRPQYGASTYAAYLRDPDGLRLEVVSRR
jgi:catechol 2,3-dioxygenase-like lactoylglutathione lyase family enzyme